MFYAYIVEWSQTDKEFIIFFCDTGKPEEYLRRKYSPHARYFQYQGKTDNIQNYINMHSKVTA